MYKNFTSLILNTIDEQIIVTIYHFVRNYYFKITEMVVLFQKVCDFPTLFVLTHFQGTTKSKVEV